MTEIELPMPPTANQNWRYWRGRVVVSAQGRAYRRLVWARFKAARVRPIQGPVCIAINLHPPDRRRRDCDNALKVLIDAIEHAGGYENDSQIVWLLTQKAQVVPGGKAVVRIWARGAGDALCGDMEQATRWGSLTPSEN